MDKNASNPRASLDARQQTEGPGGALPLAGVVSPVWKLSPNHKHGGSILYDSFELKAMTKQLNKAILGSNAPISPYSYYLKSAFHRQRLDRIYREGANGAGRISSRRRDDNVAVDAKCPKGFVARLWKVVKRGLLRSGQKQEA
ncbi:hypothetical protein NMG60_11004190 [Bertholletia excelsa]